MPAANGGQQRTQTLALEAIISQQIEDGGLLDAKLQVERLDDGAIDNSELNEEQKKRLQESEASRSRGRGRR